MGTLRAVRLRRLLLAALAIVAMALAACGSDDDSGDDAGASSTPTTEAPPADPPTESTAGCRDVKQPKPKPDGGQQKPKDKLDPAKTYDVVMKTSCGSFTIRLDVKGAPATTASFASLARNGFFENTVFHRIVPDFVIQGGDPTGTGMGGPGYLTVDPPPSGVKYTKGVVSMAKTEAEPAGTSGSQFYVVTGADAGLPPDYALLGMVTDGLAVTQRIGKLGDPNSGSAGTPTQPVVIEKATVRER